MSPIQQLQCLTCNGVYQPSQTDGLAYFHACAPTGVDAQGKPIERPNKRDENLTTDRSGNLTGIKSAGDGVKPAPGSTITNSPLLAKMLRNVPAQEED